jgi:hypothetical protein
MSYVRINKRKYHFIYKTTCSLTGKYYIGMHSTDNLDDGYLGSGRRLRYSIRKYGPENHTREILEYCSSREELASREAEIVNLNEIAKEECMNLKEGGSGGFSNKFHQLKASSFGGKANAIKIKNDPCHRDKFVKHMNKNREKAILKGNFKIPSFKGKNHTEKAKGKIGKSNSIRQSGSGNSQYGTIWITNGNENKKIKKEEKIPEAWTKGRKINLGNN